MEFNLNSIFLGLGFPGAGSCASKRSLIGISKIAATEFGIHKIIVNAICPGAAGIPTNEGHVKFREGNLPTIPFGRIDLPEETAQTIYFVISDSSSYISGADLAIDVG